MAVALTACQGGMVYHHYEHTPLAGWEKNDTLYFHIPAVTLSGSYAEEIDLRLSGDYPFMGLNLIVEQTILPSSTTRCDTLHCHVIDSVGNGLGNGVGQYQYTYPFAKLKLNEGDSLHVTIRHDMKREILPGISDIGFCLTRKD